MKNESSKNSAGRQDTMLRTNLALAGVAATLAVPADAAIVGIADLEKHIQQGESYQIPGMPQLEFRAISDLDLHDKSLRVTWGEIVATNVWDGNPKVLVSGAGLQEWDYQGGYVSLGDVVGAGNIVPLPSSWPPVNYHRYSTTSAPIYVALSLVEDQEVHYGWVSLSVSAGDGPFTIHGFGYNDEAGATIRVGQTTDIPEPGTLALLAAGAVGALGSARRRRARN